MAAVEDIVPGLVEKITQQFQQEYSKSKKIQELLEKVKSGMATYADAQEYSLEVSKLIGTAYEKHVSSAVLPDGRMYYNIASRLIPSSLDENHSLVSAYAATVQKQLNKNAGIGLRVQTVGKDEDRTAGLVDLASDAEQYDDVKDKLKGAFETYSQRIVDRSVQANAEFQYKYGLTPKIIRQASRSCCSWCQALAGEYDYPDVPEDVYRRHGNCMCTVEYDPGTGKRQNAHTKRWTSKDGSAIIEARRKTEVSTVASKLLEAPARLAKYTPETLKEALEQDGFEIKPLSHGSLKGVSFEDGGGYKVNFGDGGLIQYHPVTRSHHKGAYYKISTGKGGTKRYDTEGNEIKD